MEKKHVVIVGGGFAGLNAAKVLGRSKAVDVTLLDRRNHHLFQPLLYQVATAGLSPAEIAVPIRALLSVFKNTKVIQGEVQDIDLETQTVRGKFGEISGDYLLLAAGATHSYFGREEWELHAPGLKTLGQATEMRRRIMTAFEQAEIESDSNIRRQLLTFAVIGGGPTGVELAGALGEMTRYTLAKDFRNIDPKLTRIILVEAGPRILAAFDEQLASRATRDLEQLGVQVWINSRVTEVSDSGLQVGDEQIAASTILWAAGIKASELGEKLETPLDRQGRVIVSSDLSLDKYPNIFVAGDQAHCIGAKDEPLPGIAPVAMQQGRYIAQQILAEIQGKVRQKFTYVDKGQMATIGRRSAIVETAGLKFSGFFAWLVWLFVHIFYLSGFKNRVLVLIQWGYSYFSFARGARLIVDKNWRSFGRDEKTH